MHPIDRKGIIAYNRPTVNSNGLKVMSKEYDCPFCDNGQVTFRVGMEIHSVDECPDCKGTGELSREDYLLAQDGINALNRAMADEEYKY